jgi:hypothetical protein
VEKAMLGKVDLPKVAVKPADILNLGPMNRPKDLNNLNDS